MGSPIPILFLSTLPVTWLSMQMHHCHDPYMVVNDSIENSVWELICETTPCFSVNTCPGIWMLTYSFNCGKNFFRKSQA